MAATNTSIYCYRLQFRTFRDDGPVSDEAPCGNINTTNPVVPCCFAGDSCLTNGFCSYAHSQVGGSGYYVPSCTNSSGICPGFPYRCTDQKIVDAVWNSTSGLWQCCGAESAGRENAYTADCENPTN